MADDMWALLPSLYRGRDAENGGLLRALIETLGEQASVLHDDISRMYDNWFIETCDDWVVPYLGALVGSRTDFGRPAVVANTASGIAGIAPSRMLVANAVRWRRRKGGFGLIAQIVWDVARWPAKAVEFGTATAITQDMRSPARGGGLLALRDPAPLVAIGGPDDALPRTADVRSAGAARVPGRHGPTDIGIFIFRRILVAVERADAAAQDEEGAGCFTFDPLGRDLALHGLAPVDGVAHLPVKITRAALAKRQRASAGESPWVVDPALYGEQGAIMIWAQARDGDPFKSVEADRIMPANLGHWRDRPHGTSVAVDPERGRISFSERLAPARVRVSFRYAAAGVAGATAAQPIGDATPFDKVYVVSAAHAEGHNDLRGALDRWRADGAASALIEFRDSATYDEDRLLIDLTRMDRHLVIRAASGCRPVIRLGDYEGGALDAWRVRGGRDGIAGAAGSMLVLEGLTIAERGLLFEDYAGILTVRHCTFVPGWFSDASGRRRNHGAPSLAFENCTGAIEIGHSISGPIHIRADEQVEAPLPLSIADTILDAGDARPVLIGPDPMPYAELTVRRSTIFGSMAVHTLPFAENSLFTGQVRVERQQEGCIRFCYVTPGSRTPPRISCLPTAERVTGEAERPAFVSMIFGTPGYGELARQGNREIARGADDQEELGAFHDLYWSTRERNLKSALAEYLPVGVAAGIIPVD